MKQKLIMLRGLVASGKSTFAKEYIQKNPKTKRVNNDELRDMLDNGIWEKDSEKFVSRLRDHIISQALTDGFNVIVDNCNLHQKHEPHYREIADKAGAEFQIKDFTSVSVEECIARDRLREHPVGAKVIMQMANQFDLIPKPVQPKVAYVAGLPSCLLVDVDGTLAIHHRGPFEYEKLHTDTLNEAVRDVLRHYEDDSNVDIIIVSGRPDTYRKETEKWLSDNEVNYASLYMRDATRVDEKGNQVKDTIVKEEIYHAYIEGKYNVLFFLDDRMQIVKLFRDQIGLPVFQVNWGNF